jgi:CheY-like chemotaxis protein
VSNAGTILIVDDQEIARKTLEMLLDEDGYQLHFAENGPEALAQACEAGP